MAISCIVTEIKQGISRKLRLLNPPAFNTPLGEGFPLEFCHKVWCGKLELYGYQMVKNVFEDMDLYFYTMHERDGHSDGQTSGQTPHDGMCLAYA